MGAVIATLLYSGWQLVAYTSWVHGDGEQWDLNGKVSLSEFKARIEETVLKKLWAATANRPNGPTIKELTKQFDKAGPFSKQYIMHASAAGGAWTTPRLEAKGMIPQAVCWSCGQADIDD